MSRKKDFDYFKAMETLAENAYTAAGILEDIVRNYSLEYYKEKVGKIHEIEKDSDALIAQLNKELYESFITPIDREDIMVISEQIDDILDGINAMAFLFENLIITDMRKETDHFAEMVTSATKGVHTAVKEFHKFKNSKDLKNLILEVNNIESEGDRLFSQLKKQLFSEEENLLEIIKWKEIYDRFELILNATEDAVDTIDIMTIKNT